MIHSFILQNKAIGSERVKEEQNMWKKHSNVDIYITLDIISQAQTKNLVDEI